MASNKLVFPLPLFPTTIFTLFGRSCTSCKFLNCWTLIFSNITVKLVGTGYFMKVRKSGSSWLSGLRDRSRKRRGDYFSVASAHPVLRDIRPSMAKVASAHPVLIRPSTVKKGSPEMRHHNGPDAGQNKLDIYSSH